MFAGLIAPVRAIVPRIDLIASSALAAAAVMFGVSVIWSQTGRAKSQGAHGVLMLIGWMWVWAGADLWLRWRHGGGEVLPDSARALLILVPVLGFGTNAIYGFGVRLIPGLLNIGRLRQRCIGVAMALHNIGLVPLLVGGHTGGLIGAGMMVAAAVLYLLGMDFLRSKPSRAIHGVDVRGHILIRAAFAWLVIGLVMILTEQLVPGLPHAYSGAWRHALTVGFITTMILGVGQRIVPIFIKQPLASTRLMLVGAGLILVGNAGRVGLELATIGGWPWSFRLMGVTGVLELTALVLFTVNLAWTLRNRHHVYRAGETLTADTRVREAVNARPSLQRHFNRLGITMFDHAPFIAPSMTMGALALASGYQPGDLLAELANENETAAAPAKASHGAV